MVPKSEMHRANQVNGLYPIIRRVRRPLLPVEVSGGGQHAGAKPSEEVQSGPGGRPPCRVESEKPATTDTHGSTRI